MADAPYGLVLSDDLIDASKVTAAARAAGLAVTQARSVEALLKLAGERAPAVVVLDLQHPGLDVAAVVGKLRELFPAPRVVAYGSHVQAAALKAARQAGCDAALPRSQFF